MNTLRRVLAVAVVAVAVGAPAELAAQRLAVWVMPRGEGAELAGGAFATLLNNAVQVGLSEDQVRDISRIRGRLAERTERHAAQLRDAEIWGVDETDTAAVASLARVRAEAAAFTREAEVEVEAVLTAEQRTRVAELLQGATLAGITPGEVETVEEPPEGGTPADSARAARERIVVRVENQNFLDMSVYVYRGGQRYRLGNVSGLNTRSFVVPNHLVFGITNLRFQVDPVARPVSQLSDEVMVQPGDEVLLRVPPT